MPQDYYVILTTGMVSKVADVTVTPTIVEEILAQGFYRDVFQNFPQNSGIVFQGPGWSVIPTYDSGGVSTGYESKEDDVLAHEPPRSLTWPETHWKFVTVGGCEYYTPTRYVVSMSTDEPTI